MPSVCDAVRFISRTRGWTLRRFVVRSQHTVTAAKTKCAAWNAGTQISLRALRTHFQSYATAQQRRRLGRCKTGRRAVARAASFSPPLEPATGFPSAKASRFGQGRAGRGRKGGGEGRGGVGHRLGPAAAVQGSGGLVHVQAPRHHPGRRRQPRRRGALGGGGGSGEVRRAAPSRAAARPEAHLPRPAPLRPAPPPASPDCPDGSMRAGFITNRGVADEAMRLLQHAASRGTCTAWTRWGARIDASSSIT